MYKSCSFILSTERINQHKQCHSGPPTEGETGEFCLGPQPERDPRRPHEGPLEYLFKRSIYSNRAVRSRYSNRAVTVFSGSFESGVLVISSLY